MACMCGEQFLCYEGWAHYSLLVGGLSCFLVTFCSTMWHLFFVSTLFTMGLATFWALINTLLVLDFGHQSIASSWGFFRMTQGITSFFYPSLLGEAELSVHVYVALYIFLSIQTGYILSSTCAPLRAVFTQTNCIDRATDRISFRVMD